MSLLLLQVPTEGLEGLNVPPGAYHQDGDVQNGRGKVEGERERGRREGGRGGRLIGSFLGLATSSSSSSSIGTVVEAADALLLVLEEGPQGFVALLAFLGVFPLGRSSLQKNGKSRGENLLWKMCPFDMLLLLPSHPLFLLSYLVIQRSKPIPPFFFAFCR